MSTEAGTGVKRREFLKILGATGATTAVVGCSSEKVGKLIPYVASPDNTVPGVSQYYATTCRECATACGVMAEVRDGRPIKLDGNPDHPMSRGAICSAGLSAVQGLYNPDRYRTPMVREGNALKATTWEKAYELLAQKIGEVKSRTQALAERGFDAEQVDAEIAADRERERSLGLVFSSAITPAAAMPNEPAADPASN